MHMVYFSIHQHFNGTVCFVCPSVMYMWCNRLGTRGDDGRQSARARGVARSTTPCAAVRRPRAIPRRSRRGFDRARRWRRAKEDDSCPRGRR